MSDFSALPPVPNAEALYALLRDKVRELVTPQTRLVGIPSGGAWLAERLTADLGLSDEFGVVSSALHRDDFSQRGMSSSGQTRLNFEVNGADILMLDDVLYTGRTLRAVLNELFDYGRPARVRLAVLLDRGGRQLPMAADYAAALIDVPDNVGLRLARSDSGQLVFEYAPKLK